MMMFSSGSSTLKRNNDISETSVSEVVKANVAEAIHFGSGATLKEILNQYGSFLLNPNMLSAAFLSKQIGIVRILIKDYRIDANARDEEGLCFLELFNGCDSSDACQSLIIQFIKEFNLHVNTKITDRHGCLSPIHLAVLHKLSDVLRFLVEECNVDVNDPLPIIGGTPLHAAYATNQLDAAKLLITHGANQDAVDEDGNKPNDYALLAIGGENAYSRISKFYIRRRKLFYKLVSKERLYYQQLRDKGTSEIEAVHLTFEKFPELNDEVHRSQPLDLETTPTMKKLNHYITDMAPSYYAIGLELDVANSKLKLIKDDPSLADLKEKCCKMLEMWLETDISASWKKLCNALEEPEVSLCALAENIKKTV